MLRLSVCAALSVCLPALLVLFLLALPEPARRAALKANRPLDDRRRRLLVAHSLVVATIEHRVLTYK